MRRGADIDPIDEIVTAAVGMGANHHGAIIVLEREMSLSQYAEGGIALDATASYDLFVSIFNPGAPLHDGAVIMRQGRVAAASCFLPLTRNPQLSRKLGSRHRAAIGISEETDCVALVVSEETGKISIVFDGQLSRGLDPPALAERLRELLSLDDLAVENEEIKIAEKIPEAQPAAGMGK